MSYKFKVLRGEHAQGSKVNPTTKKKTPSKIYTKGQVFSSDKRLDEMFGPDKFQLLNDAAPVVVEDAPDDDEEEDGPEMPEVEMDEPEAQSDGLDDMSVAELRTYAEESGIDLGAARRKTDIIDVIREELATRE